MLSHLILVTALEVIPFGHWESETGGPTYWMSYDSKRQSCHEKLRLILQFYLFIMLAIDQSTEKKSVYALYPTLNFYLYY